MSYFVGPIISANVDGEMDNCRRSVTNYYLVSRGEKVSLHKRVDTDIFCPFIVMFGRSVERITNENSFLYKML